jgi:(2Fe-2S) ferredoxin
MPLDRHRRHGNPDGTLYAQVQSSDVAEIIEQHIEKGIVVKRLALMELEKYPGGTF